MSFHVQKALYSRMLEQPTVGQRVIEMAMTHTTKADKQLQSRFQSQARQIFTIYQ